jgi:hypothetical protein
MVFDKYTSNNDVRNYTVCLEWRVEMKNWKTIFIVGTLCLVVGIGTGLYLSGRKAPDISLVSTAEAAGGTVTKTDGTAPERYVYYPGTEALGKDEIRLIGSIEGQSLNCCE